MKNTVRTSLALASSVLALWFGLALFLTIHFPAAFYVPRGEAVVLLGAGFYKDGQPVPALEARLKTGINLWKLMEPKPSLIISGRKEEVRVMEQYLTARIPGAEIVRDMDGTNTAATVRGLRETGKRFIFVTQAYHMPRVRLYAFVYKVDADYFPAEPVPVAFWKLFPLAARESLAILAFPFQYLIYGANK